jgi:hypothetical protein
MKVAHIILVHNKPDQLKRLLHALSHDDIISFIHIDKKCNVSDFHFLNDLVNVVIVSVRNSVTWGGYSIAKAIIDSVDEINKHAINFEYVNLISGQDYPLNTPSAFLHFLSQHPGRIFMDYFLPGHEWLEDLRLKLFKYHLTDYKFKGSTFLERGINKVIPPIKLPESFVLIGNSGWFTFDWDSAYYVLTFFKTNKSFVKKFKFSWGSDEYLIQSILYNSPLRNKMINDNLRLINWKAGNPSPSIFTFEDRAKLLKTNKFFGRKFDMYQDERIMTWIDEANKNDK